MQNTNTTTQENYLESIIKTAFANGLTQEQILANPEACAKAHLEAQLSAIENSKKELEKEIEITQDWFKEMDKKIYG